MSNLDKLIDDYLSGTLTHEELMAARKLEKDGFKHWKKLGKFLGYVFVIMIAVFLLVGAVGSVVGAISIGIDKSVEFKLQEKLKTLPGCK